LEYARHLKENGVPDEQAEAHAEAARKFIMAELVTKADMQLALEYQTLKLTVRLGGLMVAGIGGLALLLRL
jgi:hypothetical protein